ncbi:ATP-binding protein [Halomicrobium sp. IBSBa]|uniref:ATP-binding protein n=1 Tax=Halomicrobium sp. IBSBa TaxID=2778916 RepID=UPI001ABF9EB2|nr:ATP-binding protein [Halomicrobium sp. IBSBa]MBO4247309.1 ATP-binding protein [Halomicrobium sp. IBSBa]
MSEAAETRPVNVGIDVEGHFSGLSKQSMDFHDAIAELIDNGISANIKSNEYFAQDGPDEYFRIQITIERYENEVSVIVADSGEGMAPVVLQEKIWESGNTDEADGVLNEHGFGLKNALSVLTKNEGNPPFVILSRNEDDYGSGQFGRIEGPISDEMELEIGDFRDEWNEGAGTLESPESGTRIQLSTSNDILQSAYRRASNLSTLSQALREHFGVMYRHFLQHTDRNHISINWTDHVTDDAGELSVEPIYPEFRTGEDEDGNSWYRTDEIVVEDDAGEQYAVKYKRGIVNWEETRNKYEKDTYEGISTGNGESPFRLYYKRNQTTQGIDIIYNGRTLKTGLIEKIWDRATHNDFNDFVGELIISDDAFETVNNKVDINDSSALWLDLKQKLNDNDEFAPIKFGKQEKEDSIKKRLKRKLEAQMATDAVRAEKGFDGVDIDLLQRFEEGFEYIYEVKRSKAKPIHVYQCVMYWDAYTRTQDSDLSKVVLVARDIGDNARAMLDRWNNREDEHGNEYKLTFQPLSEYDLD